MLYILLIHYILLRWIYLLVVIVNEVANNSALPSIRFLSIPVAVEMLLVFTEPHLEK